MPPNLGPARKARVTNPHVKDGSEKIDIIIPPGIAAGTIWAHTLPVSAAPPAAMSMPEGEEKIKLSKLGKAYLVAYCDAFKLYIDSEADYAGASSKEKYSKKSMMDKVRCGHGGSKASGVGDGEGGQPFGPSCVRASRSQTAPTGEQLCRFVRPLCSCACVLEARRPCDLIVPLCAPFVRYYVVALCASSVHARLSSKRGAHVTQLCAKICAPFVHSCVAARA